MSARSVTASASCAVLIALAACSSAKSSGSGTDPADSGAAPSPTPAGQPRSFRRDVIPIFAQACATQACHGDTRNDLDIHFVPSDPDALYAVLQGESPTAVGAKLIVPGDPSMSFLYAKIVGDQDNFTARCMLPGCGETMPPGTKIPSSERDTIQQWISEGATKD